MAIGSVGEGTANINNRTFFIDTKKTEEELIALGDRLDKAIKALTLYVNDSWTMHLDVDKTEDGTFLSGSVKIAENAIFDHELRDNVITKTKDGIYSYIDLDYDEEENKLIFTVNDASKEFLLPTENYIVRGEYQSEEESIIFYYKDETVEPIKVYLGKLINEWTVEGENSHTPIILTREEHDSEQQHHGREEFQDVLRADVRISDDRLNILEKTTDGRSLIVKGTADRIKFLDNTKESTVQEKIEELDDAVKVSSDDDNIIYRRSDGLFASTKLEYIPTANTLVFTTTKNGVETAKEIKLNGVDLIADAYYRSADEVLVIAFHDATRSLQDH